MEKEIIDAIEKLLENYSYWYTDDHGKDGAKCPYCEVYVLDEPHQPECPTIPIQKFIDSEKKK